MGEHGPKIWPELFTGPSVHIKKKLKNTLTHLRHSSTSATESKVPEVARGV